jgi:hypothetical protein
LREGRQRLRRRVDGQPTVRPLARGLDVAATPVWTQRSAANITLPAR